jgi:hypothetical protein
LGKPRRIKKAKEKLITDSAAGQRTKKEFNFQNDYAALELHNM